MAVAEALREYARETRRWIVLLLHSTLSTDEQDKVQCPTSHRAVGSCC